MLINNFVLEQYDSYILPTYGREELVFISGQGSYLTEVDGDKYLDLYPGWGSACLGHCHKYVIQQINDQARELIHVPNNFYHPWQSELAEQLAMQGFGGLSFFCNSGAEANEAAIKLARRYGSPKGRYEIITFDKSFHGRTLATITATGQEKYQKGFEPLPAGFIHVPFGNFAAVEKAVSDKTCAIMLEFIQGEGGVNVAPDSFFKQIETLCRKKDILFIADEVQTSIGRTGSFYGFQTFGVEPDIVTLAKALGGGFPIGAMMAKPRLKDVLTAGSHASTFGGNPLACRAALAVLTVFQQEKILDNVKEQESYVRGLLNALQTSTNIIKEIRGRGLMIGIEFSVPVARLKQLCKERHVLINTIGDTIVRLLPALNIDHKDMQHGINVLGQAIKQLAKEQ